MQELLLRLSCILGQLNAALELWRAYPYSARAHSWPPPSSGAVCSAIISLNCRVLSPVFSHAHPQHRIHYRHAAFPTVVWCHTRCPLSSSVLKFQNPEHLPPLHIPTCVQRADLSNDEAHDRHSLGRDAVPADRCTRTGRHPSAASHRREYLPSACLPSRRHF